LLDQNSAPIDFLICGVQKGGTSALDAYCRYHQDLLMADAKEVHFFDDESLFCKGKPDYRLYHQHFPSHEVGKLRGEATPIYMYWPDAPARIHAYNPDIRLIVILRDPVERAYSQWQMEFHRGLETLPFGKAVRQESTRLQQGNADHRRIYSYIDRGRYLRQLQVLWSLFGREHVLVVFNEDLRQSSANVLAQISEFLGITPFPTIGDRTINAQEYDNPMETEDRAWLYALFESEIANLELALGKKLELWRNRG
jgi:hypothetical protein